MASQLDRERERKRERKELRKGAEQFRKQFRRDPSEQEMQALRTLRRRGPGASMLVHREAVTTEPSSAALAQEFKRREKFLRHSSGFQVAQTHVEQLSHIQGALMGLMEMAGISSPIMEAHPIIAVMLEIDEFLAGRGARLLQAVADPVLPASESNRGETSRRWLASALIVGAGMSVEKFENLTKKPALLRVVSDLEERIKTAPLDHFFAEGIPQTLSEDVSARDARRERLVNRFVKHGEKLRAGSVPPFPKWVFDHLKSDVEASDAAKLRENYPVWIIGMVGHILQAKDRSDTEIRPKGGRRKISTGDEA